jgi:hypothetical protein
MSSDFDSTSTRGKQRRSYVASVVMRLEERGEQGLVQCAPLTFCALASDEWCNQMALYSARKTHTPFSHNGVRAAPWAAD